MNKYKIEKKKGDIETGRIQLTKYGSVFHVLNIYMPNSSFQEEVDRILAVAAGIVEDL